MTPAELSELLGYDFELDRFQTDAVNALRDGQSVLVAAPTGAGKTVVAEYAIAEALDAGEKVFYTTPIKALSNQKYRDLAARHGADRVGLLTGDNAINRDAPVVVMTTEVLRNMVYGGADALHGLRYVVVDEVHFLQDPYRGPVWEEVIIHLPQSVRLVGLSATVSNADELSDWIASVRGPTATVVETERPVELTNLYMVGDRNSATALLIPTLYRGTPNREGYQFDLGAKGAKGSKSRGRGGNDARGRDKGRSRSGRRNFVTPRRLAVVDRLEEEDLLPAIYFIFSRAACTESMERLIDAGVRLTTEEERHRIHEIVTQRISVLSPGDLEVLDFATLLSGLERGVAAHHAGMVPAFKEIVEACFVEGLIKVVFATETLALGINMPARSVVIEKLSKFTGETHEVLTPSQYTQLTGRAGRRGIDDHGTAIVLWSPFIGFDEVASLASSRHFELRSAFRPTYNMAANLVRRYDEAAVYELLAKSFAQFQTERAMQKLHRRARKRQADIDDIHRRLGDDVERLRELRSSLATMQSADATVNDEGDGLDRIADALSRLSPGDVVVGLPDLERAAVLSVAYRKGGRIRLKVVTPTGHVVDINEDRMSAVPFTVGQIELPEPFNPNSRRFQNKAADNLRRARLHRARERRGMAAPPVEELTDEDLHDIDAGLPLLAELERLEADLARLEGRISNRTGSIAERFRSVLHILRAWNHVDGWELTEAGERVISIYHESDLLIAEVIGRGLLDDLDTPTMAGMVSVFTYEHRSKEPPPDPWFPNREVHDRFREIEQIATDLNSMEDQHKLDPTRPPDATLFALAYAWASGQDLDSLLEDEGLSGGDFVRNIKQLIDLLFQVGNSASLRDTAMTARAAADALHRGVVVSSGAVEADDEAPLP